jgi:H+/gluconate symporter-like permease
MLGFDGVPSVKKTDESEQPSASFNTSFAAILIVIVVAIILSRLPQSAGIEATTAVALAQFAGSFILIASNWNTCKNLGFMRIFSTGAIQMWAFLILAGCVMGFGLAVQKSACFSFIVDGVFGLQLNPYISAMISVAIVAGLCADGITAMMMWLPLFGQQYVAMGVNPQALHRLLLTTSQTFDSLPHSQSVAITLSVFSLSHKDAYKDVFILTVVFPVVFSIFTCIMCMIFYPAA